ncbi:hypothetical protein RSC3_00263 [Bacillus paralicheniformis]|nr:hypothetical protein RSC3_00263 [Bacillus paralicheniformis]
MKRGNLDWNGPDALADKAVFCSTFTNFSLAVRHIFTKKCTNLRKKYVETQNRHK